ncbi:hypothetical protein H4219_006268 [Mycoemilia scoparia]|uniref:Uncharacterized protein n=1 Tax=Mycoemilia scoparia TaxID=417184 RepID=A0A9W8DI03_9FUNG|nr:hypothetical protein H4219_006268 [Mycoemilia scoparia]
MNFFTSALISTALVLLSVSGPMAVHGLSNKYVFCSARGTDMDAGAATVAVCASGAQKYGWTLERTDTNAVRCAGLENNSEQIQYLIDQCKRYNVGAYLAGY